MPDQIPAETLTAAEQAIRQFSFDNYGLDDVDPTSQYAEWVPTLAAVVAEAVLAQAAAERWIEQQLAETSIRSMDFRNGAHMDLEPARELVAHWVAAARAMLCDAPNYSETKLEFDVKVAESTELYTLVVQRHVPGALTPHEARQQAEQRVAEQTERLAAVAQLARALGDYLPGDAWPLAHAIQQLALGQITPAEALAEATS